MISMDKKYVTRDGRPVVLYCTDAPTGNRPVHGRIEGEPTPRAWTAMGEYMGGQEYPADLIEVQPEAWQAYLWRERLGTYSLLSLACTYPSYSAARAAHPDAAVIVKVPG